MKKTFKIAAAIALVATVMTGCITATVLYYNEMTKEKAEITDGKVFELAQATVTYSDGTVLSFKENGKFLRVEHNDLRTVTIITPDYAYQMDINNKTYAKQENKNGTFYYSDLSLVFPEDWFDYHVIWLQDVMRGGENNKGKMDVADKECVSYSEDNTVYAGYKRIYMYKEVDGNVYRRAKLLVSTVIDDFTVPADFKQTSSSIDFSEKFE